jgi:plastocyanin
MSDKLSQQARKTARVRSLFAAAVVLGCALWTVAHAVAQQLTSPEQIIALDECDPVTFNAVLGPDFCRNIALGALGFATTLQDLFAKAASGTPDPGWDFEPDVLTIKEGTTVSVVDQGGEPHTFTEVKKFGGGFIDGLNAGEETVPECVGGFKNVEVAKSRIIPGSHTEVKGLSKGEHRFQCCIHPWMRATVHVK